MKFLFICNGNRCRSVMAEYLLRHFAKGLPVEAKSAGTATIPSFGAEPLAQYVLRELGIDASGHQTKQVTRQLVDWADYVLTVTEGHRDMLRERFPDQAHKIFTLPEFVGGGGYIPDPRDDTIEAFRQIRDLIRGYIEELAERLRTGTLEPPQTD